MSIIDWFAQKEKKKQAVKRLEIPDYLWVKCSNCGDVLYLKDVEANLKVCQSCNHHFRISLEERIRFSLDPDSFRETEDAIKPKDFLDFFDTQKYSDRIKKAQTKTNRSDAIITGTATIEGHPINVGIMDFSFLGGSMGSVVGEKITRLIEQGIKNQKPVVIFSASGGARMQEGILSLMQMAKTSAALAKLHAAGIPYISVLCDPTTGGVSASFAMLGDINIAEPGALISFAGPRVIEQTIRQKLPAGFQRAEFLLEHGMIDLVANRKDLKPELGKILSILSLN